MVTKTSLIYAAAILSGIVTVIVFLPTVHFDFLYWDDDLYLFNNAAIRSLDLNLLSWAFGPNKFGFPITWVSFALDYHFWGLNPCGFHLTNVLLHGLTAGLAVLLAFRLIRLTPSYLNADRNGHSPGRGTTAIFVSLATGLLYALHPLRVESVAWIAERKDVLSVFFGFSAMLSYLRYVQCRMQQGAASKMGAPVWYVATLALFILAVNSKAMLVMLPAVFMIMDWYPLQRLNGMREFFLSLREKIPFLVISCVVAIRTFIIYAPSADDLQLIPPLSSRILVACKAVVKYLLLIAWPDRLSPLYLYSKNASLGDPIYVISLIAVVVITFGALFVVRRTRALLAVWLFFLVTLLPYVGVLQTGIEGMADRFTYLASFAPTLLICSLAGLLWEPRSRLKVIKRVARPVIVVVAAAAIMASVLATRNLLPVWKNTETLWSRVIALEPDNIGRAYYERALYYLRQKDYPKALVDLNKSVEIAQKKNFLWSGKLFFVRGNTYMMLGKLPKAIDDFTLALSYPPEKELGYSTIFRSRSECWRAAGRDDMARRDIESAEAIEKTLSEGRPEQKSDQH